jgi:hypothetical protein
MLPGAMSSTGLSSVDTSECSTRLVRKRPLLDEDEDDGEEDEDENKEQAEEEGTSEETNKDKLAGKDQDKKVGRRKTSRRLQCTCPPPLWWPCIGRIGLSARSGTRRGSPRQMRARITSSSALLSTPQGTSFSGPSAWTC